MASWYKRLMKSTASDPAAQKGDRPKEVREILDEQIETSLKEFNRSSPGLFTSAFAAGLEVGFSILLMGTVYTLFSTDVGEHQMHMYLSLCYSLGFIFVIIGRSELFTEHTALAILPVLSKSVSVRSLLTLWGLVYAGNLVGGYLFSLILTRVGPTVGFLNTEALHHLAIHLVAHSWDTTLMSAILAGWMMGLLGWLVTSSQETISRIFVIILVTTIIGLAGLAHCIVGSIEVFSGFLVSDDISFMDYLQFQTWATVGNVLGGSFFVAVLKYSHVRLTSRDLKE